MSRLILFSGGVESTAMLTLANENDIVTTIRDTSKDMYRTYSEKAVEEITKKLEIPLHYTDIALPLKHRKDFLYQLLTFIHAAGLWVTRFPEIKEVWYGLDKDGGAGVAKKDFDYCVDFWKRSYPNIELVFPFQYMETKDIWKLIPKDIQKLVINCTHPQKIQCNDCHKCSVLRKLKG